MPPNMMYPAHQVAVIEKIRIKDSEIPVPGSVIAILKTVVVSLCLKSYFQISVFTTVLTVFEGVQMM